MNKTITISLDAMGGDNGVEVILAGAELALKRMPHIKFILFGDEEIITPALAAHPALAKVSEVDHCDVAVAMDAKPSTALRQGRYKSSMWRAIEAAKDGRAGVCVSAGNTGALMAMSKFCLRSMPGVERPAIAAIWPTLRGDSIVLDMGATIGADAKQLVSFSMMGGAMARALFSIKRPTVGLLNVGVEEIKGVEYVREAGAILKEANFPFCEYIGFVEGDDIGKGTANVVVTEGFSGNIALKTAEGTARQIATYLRESISRSFMGRIGYIFAKGAFNRLKDKMDPSKSNGGVFLGLNGLVIKSHGSASPEGIASAIGLGEAMTRNDLLQKLSDDMAQFQSMLASEQESKD